MTEKRYAILIGMDNYSIDKLPYCVKNVTVILRQENKIPTSIRHR